MKEKFLESIENENRSINNFHEEMEGEKVNEKNNKNKKLKNEKIKKCKENEIGSDNNDKRIFLTVPVTLNICSDISALALGK